MRFPVGTDHWGVLFSPLTNNTHLDICDTRIVVPCFANLLYQCFHTILESRIKIASYHRIRCTRFLCIGYVGWETNAVKSVRITDCRCSHPVNIHSWNDFDILFFYAFPSMITIGYYFFDTVCLYVFYAIPRNVFFVYRSVWKRIIGWNRVQTDRKYITPTHHRITERLVI